MKVFASLIFLLLLTGAVWAEGDPWGAANKNRGNSSLDTRWGPDAFGYTARNNAEADGPLPNYVDISTWAGALRVQNGSDDNAVGPFNIGFNFHYYWYDVTQFWIGSNGFIKFSTRGQIAKRPSVSTMPTFPDALPPNDVVGPYVADWYLAANNPTDSVAYYWSNHTDTLIVMWKNVPISGSGGSHSFEVILSGADSSITFQYGSMGTNPTTDAVGIENVTGTVGLVAMYGAYPAANTAIKFYYPATIAFHSSIKVVAAVQNPLSNGFFVRPGDSLRPWLQVANLGNVLSDTCAVHFAIHRPGGAALVSFDTVLSAIFPLDTITFTPALAWGVPDTGVYLEEATAGGRTQRTEFHSVTLPGQLAYDDGGADWTYSWTTGGRAVAQEFVPSYLPATVSQVRVYVNTASSAFDVTILRGDGSGGPPISATPIWQHHVASATTGWNVLTVPPDSCQIFGGSFFVTCWPAGGQQLGFDTTSAQGISHRTWEYLNVWGQNKWWNLGDAMIRCQVNPVYPPPEAFQRVFPPDGSTQAWLQGYIPFRWTAAHDSGTSVTYHLTITSGDYTHYFTTVDTTYSDSLYWCWLGIRRADARWTVWATNGRDSTQATNGQGTFHLNANHLPSAFDRAAPTDNSTIRTSQSPDTFLWTRSTDADSDAITYALTVMGRDSSLHRDTTMHFTTTDTIFVNDLRQLWPRGFPWLTRVRWSVRASDNSDTTTASNNPGLFTLQTITAADDHPDALPHEYALRSYPNPFNSIAVLSYDVPQSGEVELKIFNLAGEEVAVLHRGELAPGRYRAEWNAGEQASGTYFAVLKAGSQTKIQKLLLLK